MSWVILILYALHYAGNAALLVSGGHQYGKAQPFLRLGGGFPYKQKECGNKAKVKAVCRHYQTEDLIDICDNFPHDITSCGKLNRKNIKKKSVEFLRLIKN